MQFLTSIGLFGLACLTPVSAQVSIYDLWFHPNGRITRFESTLITPQFDPQSGPANQAEFSTMMTTPDAQHLVRNIVTSSAGPNTYTLYTGYAPDPNVALSRSEAVYPGQAITSLFSLDITKNGDAGIWKDAFVIQNGGAPGGHSSGAGAVDFDPSKVPSKPNGPYTEAFLAADLRGTAKWTFGPVKWNNVIVQAQTKSTDWCTNLHIDGKLDWSHTPPIVTIDGDTVVCYIECVSFNGPK